MPGIVVHTLVGAMILDRWSAAPLDAPFPAGAPGLRDVFLAGCMGPDMGMYPGGAALLSDLAHYVRSAQLTRELVRQAAADSERAFAWGWAAHALADVVMHPIVNLAAGDARSAGPLTFADDPWLHLAVEVGVEGYFYRRWEERGLNVLPALPPEVAGLVARAVRGVYGAAVGEDGVRACLAAWARWHGFSVAAGGAAARLYGRTTGWHGRYGLVRRGVKVSTGVFGRGTTLHALTHPLLPSDRALDLIDRAVAEFPDRFRDLVGGGLAGFPDFNLDTGALEGPVAYPLTAKTLARLAAGA